MFLDVTWLEKPKIFISSTMDKNTDVFRKAIMDALKTQGYEILAFETNSFPYSNDNSNNIIEDTVNAVANANVFVLILDENFGTIVNDQSVIQKEYCRAKELKIPTYVFIQEDVWRQYKEKNISSNGYIKTWGHYDFIKAVSEYKISEYKLPDDCVDHIKAQLLNFLGGALRFSTKASWLWNENYTRSIEKKASEVWIITPDFMWDFKDEEFRNIVSNNITKRNCKYKYIFLANEKTTAMKEEMMRYYKKVFAENQKDQTELQKQVLFVPVKPSKFFWSCEQIIFNPFTLDERAIMVDVMDVRDRTLKFNTEFGLEKRLAFREQFINYWNSHVEDKSHRIDKQQY